MKERKEKAFRKSHQQKKEGAKKRDFV